MKPLKSDWLHSWKQANSKDFSQLGWSTMLTKHEKKGRFATLKNPLNCAGKPVVVMTRKEENQQRKQYERNVRKFLNL